MINLNHFGFGDFYENQLSEDDKNNFNIARVIAEHKNAFVLKCEEKDCRAVISGKFFHNIEKSADLPVVGDWVLVRKDAEDPLIIEKILKRKTMLSRKTPADRKTFGNDKEQVLVSNVDVIFIATSLNQNFSLSRIERALVLVYKSGATPVILLSKADLCDSVEEKVESVKRIAFGVPVIAFSSFKLSGIDEIVSFIKPGKTVCLLGSSGVGKTSLMNVLCGQVEKTEEIREKDTKGRHATTARSMYFLSNGGMIIDTPGIREMGVLDLDDNIENTYADIEELTHLCKFSNCSHQTEPGCAVKQAIASGTLDERRFKNYLKMEKENSFQEDKAGALKSKQQKHKQISRWIKQMKL